MQQNQPLRKNSRNLLTAYILLLLATLALLGAVAIIPFISTQQQGTDPLATQAASPTPAARSLAHAAIGFSIITPTSTPEDAQKANKAGINTILEYLQEIDPAGPIGQTMRSLHMKEISGVIWAYLHEYECHRGLSLGYTNYCAQDYSPPITDTTTLYNAITEHVQQDAANPLIGGYWVLDDWPNWDDGAAQPILVHIHQIIQRYTPDLPAICGFGWAYLAPNKTMPIGDPQTFANFSPQGCDIVAPYIYDNFPNTTNARYPSSAFDWSMRGLPTYLADLKAYHWDQRVTPLLGVVQAFGNDGAGGIPIITAPAKADMPKQASAYCAAGAVAIAFYAWSDSKDDQTPANTPFLLDGVQSSIAACQHVWSTTPPMLDIPDKRPLLLTIGLTMPILRPGAG